jgi:hypothetical protein
VLYIKAKDLLNDPGSYLDKRSREGSTQTLDMIESEAFEDTKLFVELTSITRPWGEGEMEYLRSRINHLENFCHTLCMVLPEETRDKLLAEQGWIPYTEYVKRRLELLREEYKPKPRKRK